MFCVRCIKHEICLNIYNIFAVRQILVMLFLIHVILSMLASPTKRYYIVCLTYSLHDFVAISKKNTWSFKNDASFCSISREDPENKCLFVCLLINILTFYNIFWILLRLGSCYKVMYETWHMRLVILKKQLSKNHTRNRWERERERVLETDIGIPIWNYLPITCTSTYLSLVSSLVEGANPQDVPFGPFYC